jgi:hypothetical protein
MDWAIGLDGLGYWMDGAIGWLLDWAIGLYRMYFSVTIILDLLFLLLPNTRKMKD